MEWKDFENKVANLLRMFGYDVVQDTKLQAGQTDIVAKAKRRSRPNLMVECKFHEKSTSKVGIEDVDKFVARVVTLRMNGDVDLGYLVTNTGFTASARGKMDGENYSKFAFLATYDELLHTLLDASGYLEEFVRDYEEMNRQSAFVPLQVVDTTDFDGTVFDLQEGEILSPSRQQLGAPKQVWIGMPAEASQEFLSAKLANQVPEGRAVRVDIDALLGQTEQLQHARDLDFIMRAKRWNELLSEARSQAAIEAFDRLAARYGTDGSVNRCSRLDTLWHGFLTKQLSLKQFGSLPVDDEALSLETTESSALSSPSSSQLPPTDPVPEIEDTAESTTVPAVLGPRAYRLERDVWRRSLQLWVEWLEDAASRRPAPSVGLIHDWLPCIEDAVWFHARVHCGLERIPNDVRFFSIRDGVGALESILSSSDDTNFCVLLGDYGAGKSTLLNELMYELARRKISASSDPSVPVPLLMNLREYNKVPNFERFVKAFINDEAEMGDINIRHFKQLVNAGQFVLLLDGFDEMLEKVTRPDRRRCFREIADFVGPGSKVILSGRPAYFPDHAELTEVLSGMRRGFDIGGKIREIHSRTFCVQLMNDDQIQKFLEHCSERERDELRDLLEANPALHDLARRPVLAAIIIESYQDLRQLSSESITVRKLYEVYTNRWVRREEDKGSYRLLIDADRKETFVRYLAMQMHLSGSLTISYHHLDKRLAEHFHLDVAERIDHFSHDVRTCSFLNRTDDGEYRFIHKSFMEYFVVREFERLDQSPFASSFDKPLTQEMMNLLDWAQLPLPAGRSNVRKEYEFLQECVEKLSQLKDDSVRNGEYEQAAGIRDVAQVVREAIEKLKAVTGFQTMRAAALSYPPVIEMQAHDWTRDWHFLTYVEPNAEWVVKLHRLLEHWTAKEPTVRPEIPEGDA